MVRSQRGQRGGQRVVLDFGGGELSVEVLDDQVAVVEGETQSG